MSVNYYDENANIFFETTVNADMSYLYKMFEDRLACKGKILDLGCGSGRDSKYFLSKGYEVVALDYSTKLARLASEYIGQEVVVADMRTIDYNEIFEGIWACASFLHLSYEDVVTTLEKSYKALKEGGIIYLSFKYGNDDYSKEGRNFTCFTEDRFLEVLKKIRFSKYEFFQTGDVRAGRENEKWLNVILWK